MMEKIDAFSVFFSVFLTLVFVLFLAWFFLHWLGQRSSLRINSQYIHILDRVTIDRERYLLLVSVGDKTMLIGMCSGAVETICEFTPEQQALYFSSHEPEQSFSSVMKRFMPRQGKGGSDR